MPAGNTQGPLENIQKSIFGLVEKAPFEDWIWAGVTFFIGITIVRVLDYFARTFIPRLLPEKHAPIFLKILRYIAYLLVVLIALSRAGFDISVLLGAAGILTVALGFASQTSASNVISGLFLVGERPFVVGDIIRVDQIVGTVETIDFVSVKLRTFDNLYARIPNEILFKSTIVNHTHYPVRRIDIEFPLAPEIDIERIRDRMIARVQTISTVLDEPPIVMQLIGFQSAGLQVRFCAWTTRANFRETRTQVCLELIRAFREEEMTLPGDRRQLLVHTTKALDNALQIQRNETTDTPTT